MKDKPYHDVWITLDTGLRVNITLTREELKRVYENQQKGMSLKDALMNSKENVDGSVNDNPQDQKGKENK